MSSKINNNPYLVKREELIVNVFGKVSENTYIEWDIMTYDTIISFEAWLENEGLDPITLTIYYYI